MSCKQNHYKYGLQLFVILHTFASEFQYKYKKMEKKNLLIGILMAGVSLTASGEGNLELADSSKVVDLDEVVIVAQPKETARLRQQPLSSSVFSSHEIQMYGVRDLRQLSVYVPSFSMPDYGSRITSSMYIRGIGSRVSNSAIGVYYDNIPLLSPAAFNSNFYMIDRVDVLRGPQGTLYGANSEGGIVRIYSKNPMTYQGTDVALGLASGVQRHAELAHYHRPSDKLAFSVAGFYRGQRGFFRNEFLNEYSDKMNEAGGKLRLIWKPNKRLTFDITSDYQFTQQNGFPYGKYSVDEQWAALPSTNVMPGYKRNMVNSGLGISYDMDQLLLSSNTSYQHLYDDMDMDIDYTPADRMMLNQRQKMNAVTEELTLRSKGTGMWQHVSGLFGSQRWLRTDATVDFGRDILDPIGNGIGTAMRNAQYASVKAKSKPAMKAAMKATMKAAFLLLGMPEAAAEAAAEKAAEEAAEKAASEAAQKAVDAAGLDARADVMRVPNVFQQPTTNLAVFHESTLSFGRFVATLGLRYDFTRVGLDYDAMGYMSITGGSVLTKATYTLSSKLANNYHTTFGQLLPKVGLSYKLCDNGSNIYATVSKGYMAGGYNIQLFSDILNADLTSKEAQQKAQRGDYDVPHTEQDYANIEDAITYKPEESWNYELGAHLNILGDRLHADVALFYTQLRNQQLTVMAPEYGFGRMTVNAGKSRSLGAELALRGNMADGHLTWAASYSYTNAKFVDYKDMKKVDGVNVEVDYNGKYVPYIPQHVYSVAADYRFDISGDAFLRSVTLGLNAQGNGKVHWDDANTASQKAYVLLGAHANADFGIFNVDVWGRNLTNTHYCTFAMPFDGNYIGQRGAPIQVGVDVKVHF